jgi:hypothetical protein
MLFRLLLLKVLARWLGLGGALKKWKNFGRDVSAGDVIDSDERLQGAEPDLTLSSLPIV